MEDRASLDMSKGGGQDGNCATMRTTLTIRLKALDNTTKVLRQSAKAPQRAPSVSGIGTVVEKPDYSEAKIVVAMVCLTQPTGRPVYG